MAGPMVKRPGHRFGGAWTDQKLDILEGYLAAYTTALQHASFTKGYIDAFAGSGYRDAKRGFPDLSEQEPQELLEGSARRALRVQPRFDGYVFIESHAGRRSELEALKTQFPEEADAIQIRSGDANQQLSEICALPWASRRAVLFLETPTACKSTGRQLRSSPVRRPSTCGCSSRSVSVSTGS